MRAWLIEKFVDQISSHECIDDIKREKLKKACKKYHTVKGFDSRVKMLRRQEKNPEEFEDTYYRRSIVESVFSSFKCRFTASCSRKEAGNAKTAVTSQAHLLQPVVIAKRHQKIRAVCLAYAVQPCNVLAQDTPHHILPRENSAIYKKSKAIKCR